MKLGNSEINKIKLGTNNVSAVYLGTNKVFGGPRLPSEYQEVEYIASGQNTYILTNLFINDLTYEFDFKGKVTNSTISDVCFFYDHIGGDDESTKFGRRGYTNKNFVAGYKTNGISGTTSIDLGDDVLQIIEGTMKYDGGVANGVQFTLQRLASFYPNDELRIANPYTRTYKFKISKSGTLIRDYVPCYRKVDSIAGMYDVVNNVFYTNSGTGADFIVGPDVN